MAAAFLRFLGFFLERGNRGKRREDSSDDKETKQEHRRRSEKEAKASPVAVRHPANIESISITFWARQKAVIVRM